MPDYNPDREGHHKHKFIVQKAFPSDDLTTGVETSKGVLKSNKQGRMVIAEESLAREIQQDNPRELVVTRMNEDDPADRGHNYFFSMPEMPWKRQHREAEAQEVGNAEPDEQPAEEQEVKNA
jgi:hypothetical protein